MKKYNVLKKTVGMAFILLFISCEDFLEVEAPDQKIISETIFTNDATAISAMKGIYNQLFQASYSAGWEDSVTVLAGLTADELECVRSTEFSLIEYERNEINPDNPKNLSLWSSAYNIIYMTNSLLEGLKDANSVSEEVRKSLQGEAKFVRAFTYFYLVNLYGEVPLVLTTDYRKNSKASKISKEELYQQILADLTDAKNLLPDVYRNDDRTTVNKTAATALLARVNLYLGNWQEAENLSTSVIEITDTYNLLDDLDKVFLANSKEAIWQISPIGGGGVLTFTNEGAVFIFHPVFTFLTKVRLTKGLVDIFDPQDKRLMSWVGYNEKTDSYFSYKYKDRSSMDNITEYSMVLRLAEQYLIRAEARTRLHQFPQAIADINIIRKRADLDLVAEDSSQLTEEDLIDLILVERRRELFTEWGHRWLDLKRLGRASQVLKGIKASWEETDVLYPIPADERLKNPELGQNPGY